MLQERFIRPVRLPGDAIPLIVLIRNEPGDVAHRLTIRLALCLQLSLEIVGARAQHRIRGNIRVFFGEQLRQSLLNAGPCRLVASIWSLLRLSGAYAKQYGNGGRGHPDHHRRPCL